MSEAHKILRLNGKTVSTELLSKDKYYPLDRIIKIGTKEAVETVAPVEEKEEEQNNEQNKELENNQENSEIEQEGNITNQENAETGDKQNITE